MGHNVIPVGVDPINPVACHLSTIGFHAGYDPMHRFLAAHLAALELEALDHDAVALVARYHEIVAELGAEVARRHRRLRSVA